MNSRDKLIEMMAEASWDKFHGGGDWGRNKACRSIGARQALDDERSKQRAGLDALLNFYPSMARVINGTGVVMPKRPKKTLIEVGWGILKQLNETEHTDDDLVVIYTAMINAVQNGTC